MTSTSSSKNGIRARRALLSLLAFDDFLARTAPRVGRTGDSANEVTKLHGVEFSIRRARR